MRWTVVRHCDFAGVFEVLEMDFEKCKKLVVDVGFLVDSNQLM